MDKTMIEGTKIKNYLPAILGDKKMSIRELSEETGITYTMIRDLYHGQRQSVKWETIDKVCEVLDVDVGDLFRRVK